CQVDHVEPWSAGGLTVDDNGRLACGFHNRLRNGRSPPPPA
ncbi:MAG: endonuclease, partial [Actinomycetota bacterium]|nr:endonuclease [Actinomycetota bacterium]